MKKQNTRRGFTLIELLVVVLIIGILAAVALPQYNKAVEKSRLTEVLQNINLIKKCFSLYTLEHGLPAQGRVNLKDMNCAIEINLDESKDFEYGVNCASSSCNIVIIRQPFLTKYVLEGGYPKTGNEEQKCYTLQTDIGRFICKSLENQGWTYIDEEY